MNEKGAAAVMAVELDQERGPQVCCVSIFEHIIRAVRVPEGLRGMGLVVLACELCGENS